MDVYVYVYMGCTYLCVCGMVYVYVHVHVPTVVQQEVFLLVYLLAYQQVNINRYMRTTVHTKIQKYTNGAGKKCFSEDPPQPERVRCNQ